MRDPNRIDIILKEIETIWKKSPDLRLMQLLLNAIGSNILINTEHEFKYKAIDHYNTEDDIVLLKLRNLYGR